MRSSSSLSLFRFCFLLFTSTSGEKSRAADDGIPSSTYRQIKTPRESKMFEYVLLLRLFPVKASQVTGWLLPSTGLLEMKSGQWKVGDISEKS